MSTPERGPEAGPTEEGRGDGGGPARTGLPGRGAPDPDDRRSPVPWLMGGLLALAAALRAVGLDRQLWLDEIAALTASVRRPVLEIVSEWPAVTSHPLFDLLAHASVAALGETALALRLPAALFGVAGVWVLYRLGREVAGPATGVVAAALLAVSYHHVYFSQNARGYTALLFFYLAASVAALPAARRTLRRREGVAYAASGALAAYAHPFGVFVVPGHLLAIGASTLRRQRDGTASAPARERFASLLTWGAVAGGAAALLYLPYLGSILEMAREKAGVAAEGPTLGLGLAVETLEGLRVGLGGTVPLLAAAAAGALGTWLWARRHPHALGLVAAPLALQAAAFGAVGLGLHPRYFLPALPVAVLLGASGLLAAVRAPLQRALPSRPALRRWVGAGVLAAAVLATAAPLERYYRHPKQDYTGALREARSLAERGGTPVGVHLAGHVLNGHYGAGFASADDLADLRSLEARHDTLLLVTTLERVLAAHDSALHNRIHRSYERVRYLPGTVGDGALRIYRGPAGEVGAPGPGTAAGPSPGSPAAGDGASAGAGPTSGRSAP